MNQADTSTRPAISTPLNLASLMPFADQIGIKLESASKDEVRGEIEWRADLCTTAGVMHGGVLMSFADSLGAICALLNVPPGGSTATIESKTNFFRAIRRGPVKGVSKPLHVGRTTVVVQTDLFDTEQRRVAQVTQTQAILTG
jgi:1,4-dihydroxy-2-naphthoyl-CoA hydrolase